ncbi:uncharacterized protein LODBEIA_P21670 [Lodderomyces beijingensis]|uniref:Uncharacterized protein n=1 Tax=Lodderomyces beijingensis TaxID=1775926 RepID=A0ABP0ZIG7_9ASCO
MQSIQSLRDEIINSKAKYNIIELIPDDLELGDGSERKSGPFTTHADDSSSSLEIGVHKRAYLEMFMASHAYFYEHRQQLYNLQALSLVELRETYLMTLGYLITTNENHTIIKVHAQTVAILDNWLEDLEIVTSFLTCRMARINKSSSLWAWLRRVVQKCSHKREHGSKLVIDDRCISRALKSCDLHFANYYGNSFLRWCIEMEGYHEEFKSWWRQLAQLCDQRLSDSSLWGTLNFLLSRSRGENGEPRPRGYTSNLERHRFIVQKLAWLVRVNCKYRTPYRMLISAVDSLGQLQIIRHFVERECDNSVELGSNLLHVIETQVHDIESEGGHDENSEEYVEMKEWSNE